MYIYIYIYIYIYYHRLQDCGLLLGLQAPAAGREYEELTRLARD